MQLPQYYFFNISFPVCKFSFMRHLMYSLFQSSLFCFTYSPFSFCILASWAICFDMWWFTILFFSLHFLHCIFMVILSDEIQNQFDKLPPQFNIPLRSCSTYRLFGECLFSISWCLGAWVSNARVQICYLLYSSYVTLGKLLDPS